MSGDLILSRKETDQCYIRLPLAITLHLMLQLCLVSFLGIFKGDFSVIFKVEIKDIPLK